MKPDCRLFRIFAHSITVFPITMPHTIAISEAASIAIHSLVLIAQSSNTMNVVKIAERTGSSKHHVAKVLQRLVKEGILNSNRGPSGGFYLRKPSNQITLLKIYEIIEGQIEITSCPMEHPVCPFDQCLMGNIVSRLSKDFRDYLESQTLANFIGKAPKPDPQQATL